jgi:transcriptional regulator with XRE-family HTH domain
MPRNGVQIDGLSLMLARQTARLTGRELADRCGLSPQHLYRIEAGNSLPSLKTLDSFAQHLGQRPVAECITDERYRTAFLAKDDSNALVSSSA